MTPEGEWQSFCGNQAADKLCTSILVDEQYGYLDDYDRNRVSSLQL